MILRRSRSAGVALLGAACLVLAACAGLPDQSFGTGGITVVPGNGQWEATVPLTGGKYLAAENVDFSSGKVWRFNANGSIDTTYADHGAFSVNCGGFTVAPDGRFFCFNDNADDVVTAYTATATPDTAFNGGSIDVPFMTGSYGSGVDSAGNLYLLFGATGGAQPPPTLTFRRYNTAGVQDAHYVADMGPAENAYVAGFGPGGSMFAVHDLIQNSYALTKFTSSGAPDTTFGNQGSITLPTDMVIDSVAVDSLGGVAMLVHEGRTHVLLRYTAAGQADRTFGWNGIAPAPALVNTGGPLTVDAQRRVILTASRGQSAGPVQVLRFLTNGQLDPAFGTGGRTTLTEIHGVSLLNSKVFSVNTDAANRPVLWLSPDGAGSPALARLGS